MIIWTALPNGYSDADAGFRLTVLVSPRLPSLALGEFTDWPTRIHDLKFDVVFADTAGATTFTNVKPLNDLNPELWLRVFKNTIVRDAEETRKEAFESKVRSYRTQAIAKPIRVMYAAAMHLAQPNTSRPLLVPAVSQRVLSQMQWFQPAGPGPFVHDPHNDSAPLPVSRGGLRDVYRLSAHPDVMLRPDVIRLVKGIHGEAGGITSSAGAGDFLNFGLFHRRVQNQPFHQPAEDHCREFHRQVALLLNYPALLRPLGLALDLILPAPRSAFPSTTGRVSVRPSITFAAGFEPCLPWTRFEPAGGVPFRPAADDDTCSGMLRLQDPSFELESLDVDSAAMNMIGLADTRARGALSTAPDSRNDDTMPALRTAGIAVISHGRQGKVEDAIDRAKDFENRCHNHVDIILTARDVTAGYVVDVHSILPGSSSGEWRSLCDRHEKFIIDGDLEIAFPNCAGIVRPGTSRAVDKLTTQKEPPNELYVHEALFRWTGWSLTVRRPEDIKRVGVTRSNSDACEWIRSQFTAIRLPRLRFGGEYRFRARLADLAGNTLAPEEATEVCSTPAGSSFVFRRYEPVPAPPILLVDVGSFRPDRGDQLNRLVVRDGGGRSTRCCVPPRTSQETAELHGMFDSQSLPARGSFQAVGLESNGEFFQESQSKNPMYVAPRGTRPDPPYYPDPLAHRAQLVMIDDLASPPSIKPFAFYDGALANQWPHAGRFFVTVIPTPKRQQIGARWTLHDTLEIALPPGRQATLRVSSQFRDTESVHLMALVQEAGPLDMAVISAGSHEMVTPAEEMHLVHAVKQPIETPMIRASLTERLAGSTTAKLDFQIDVDDKSTGRVEVVADWTETVDDPSQDGPETRKGHAPLTEENRAAPAALDMVTVPLPGIEQRFSDSKYRCIDYTSVASTRFAEYFKEKDPRAFTKTSSAVHVAIPSSARPLPVIPLYVLPTFGWASSRSGKRFFSDRAGGGLRVYFSRPWYATGDGELVGIVVAPAGFSGDDSTGLTRWGIDPTFKAVDIPDFPTADHFEGHVHVRTHVAVPLDSDKTPNTVIATVVGYQPVYDPVRKLWYADVIVRNPGAYTPFIRLSIVRFQPVSLHGLEASMFVPAEFAQLFPSRRVSVTRGPTRDSLCVHVGGDPIPPGDDPAKRFRITVDRQCIDLAGGVSWLPIPTINSACTETPPAETLFSTKLSVGNACGPMRLRIEELETRTGDDGKTTRLIYADVLEL